MTSPYPYWFSNPRLECLDCTAPVAPGRRRCLDCLEIQAEKSRQLYLKLRDSKPKRRCTTCGRRGHYSSTCGTDKAKTILTPSCSFCGERGHYAKTCEKRKRAISESLLKRSSV